MLEIFQKGIEAIRQTDKENFRGRDRTTKKLIDLKQAFYTFSDLHLIDESERKEIYKLLKSYQEELQNKKKH